MKTDDERMQRTMTFLAQTFGVTARLVLIKLEDSPVEGQMDLRISHQNIDGAQTIAVMAQAAQILRAAQEMHDAPTIH